MYVLYVPLLPVSLKIKRLIMQYLGMRHIFYALSQSWGPSINYVSIFFLVLMPPNRHIFVPISRQILPNFWTLKVRWFRKDFWYPRILPKMSEQIHLYTTANSFVHFLGEFEDTKKSFEIIWPLPFAAVFYWSPLVFNVLFSFCITFYR